jgi:hypothetical protein
MGLDSRSMAFSQKQKQTKKIPNETCSVLSSVELGESSGYPVTKQYLMDLSETKKKKEINKNNLNETVRLKIKMRRTRDSGY